MKNFTLILVVLIVFSIEANSQIPNSGFEVWEDYVDNGYGCDPPINTYLKPNVWVGSLPYSCEISSFSLERNNESYPLGTGMYSLKIQADIPNGVRGVAISSDAPDPMTNWIPQPSFEMGYRPESLFLYYKCFPHEGDSIIANIYLYKDGVVIGNPYWLTTQTVPEWTPLEIPMTYYNSEIPDSATILFVTGAYIQHSESILYVDNLSFSGFVSANSEKLLDKNINIYPNPANEFFNIEIDESVYNNQTLYIFNIVGELVKIEQIQSIKHNINIEDLHAGIYIVEIDNVECSSKQKLIIKR
ncbi:MAG TPA: T9SS type A sorting domain-containing protein [Bacteroidales bacterium]|nr:T9SS type A sorting domain-containing protein [Bacteroidales bacterium]